MHSIAVCSKKTEAVQQKLMHATSKSLAHQLPNREHASGNKWANAHVDGLHSLCCCTNSA